MRLSQLSPLIAGLLIFAARGWAATPTGRSQADSVISARGKLLEAQRLLMTQRPLDVPRFAQIINEAHQLAPALDWKGAALIRREVILFFPHTPKDATLAGIDMAVMLSRAMAFDDTLRAICALFGERPPKMAKLMDAKLAAEQRRGPPSEPKAIPVVAYQPPPEGTFQPLSSPLWGDCVARSGEESWPRFLSRVEPVDPRGPNAPEATVSMTVLIEVDGHASEIEDVEGPPELQAAALNAVRASTFRPFTFLGMAAATRVRVPVSFARKS